MILSIRLIGDGQDRIARLKVDPQIKYGKLQELIETWTQIPPLFQEIKFRGDHLPATQHPINSIAEGEELIVKHSMVANWEAFKISFDMAKKALQSKEDKKVEKAVGQALDDLTPLVKANFLVAYPSLRVVYWQFTTEFAHYVDTEFDYIELAAKDYFLKFFRDDPEYPSVKIECEEKPDKDIGLQGGLICKVSRDDVLLGKYYVKEHFNLQNDKYAKSADLRELFVYKLFEIINVGPAVHFLPNVHYSSFGLYIATEEVSGFRRADSKDKANLSPEQYAQRDLLRRVLSIKDLHSKNYGLDVNGKLSIVDFQVKNDTSSEKVNKYLKLKPDKPWKGNKELQIRVGKECFELWDFPNVFDKAEAGIANQKKLFQKHSISYKPSKSLDEYLIQIKSNVQALVALFE